MNSLGLLTSGRRRRAGWAPLGRSVAFARSRAMEAAGLLRKPHVGEKNETSLGQREGGGGVSAHGHI
jgi:hypothetical protein